MRLVLLALLTACRIRAPFECDFDEQCRSGDIQGSCQLEQWCTFPDDKCDSGQRYADNAGDGLGGTCFGTTAPSDASIDAAPFDTSLCPQSYTRRQEEADAGVGSRYRLITANQNVWTHAAACSADLPGATHLIVLDNAAELALAQDMFPLFPPLTAWVGVVQDPAATAAASGWIDFAGRPAMLWASNQPDNQGRTEVEVHANVAELGNSGNGIVDVVGTSNNGAICECDGIPMNAMAQAFLDGDPTKP